ncbi:hypothetical protein MXB_2538 [Myxobolus squamalis]|nr:hypothetical protein MXB_2538 [Myxobolus squamalis]
MVGTQAISPNPAEEYKKRISTFQRHVPNLYPNRNNVFPLIQRNDSNPTYYMPGMIGRGKLYYIGGPHDMSPFSDPFGSLSSTSRSWRSSEMNIPQFPEEYFDSTGMLHSPNHFNDEGYMRHENFHNQLYPNTDPRRRF